MIKLPCVCILIAALCMPVLAADGVGMYASAVLLEPPHARGPYVELLIRNTRGEQTGYDRRSGKTVSGLRQGCYVEEGTGNEPRARNLVLMEPAPDTYLLDITGTDSGLYTIETGIVLHNEFMRTTIAGIIGKGDVQHAVLLYTGNAGISKQVDADVLRREVEIALKRDLLDGALGKETVLELRRLKKAMGRKDPAEARGILKKLETRLKIERAKYALTSEQDVRAWFLDHFSKTPARTRDVLRKKDLYFSRIENIRPEKRDAWCRAQVLGVLLADVRTLSGR